MKLLKKILFGKHSHISFSQCGEDIIVEFIMNVLKIKKPTYFDIGAHDSKYLSNTYLFYKKGSHGICVEPDPFLHKKIQLARPRDICLNVGVGIDNRTSGQFYIMSTRTLNTFSKEEALRYESYGTHKIDSVVEIPLLNINQILEQYWKDNTPCPNFFSIDVEGLDYEVLTSIDFEKYRPEVISIETIKYTEGNEDEKDNRINDWMISKGYMQYADTYINTIFVDYEKWKVRNG